MNWQKELVQARTAGEVLEIVNDFLQAMPQVAREALAMPRAVLSAREVYSLHRRLADAASDAPGDDGLQETAVFFVHAAARLAQLNGGGNGDGRHEATSNQGDFRVRGNGNGDHGPH